MGAMTDPDRGAFPFRIGIAAVGGVLPLGAVAEGRAATDAQQTAKWGESSTDDPCSNESIAATIAGLPPSA